MQNNLLLNKNADDIKTMLATTEVLINDVTSGFDKFWIKNQEINHVLIERVNTLTNIKIDFLALMNGLDTPIHEFEQKLSLLEKSLRTLIDNIEFIEQEVVNLQQDFNNVIIKFNHLHEQSYGLEQIDISSTNEVPDQLIVELNQQLCDMKNRKEVLEKSLANCVTMLQSALDNAQNEFNYMISDIESFREEPRMIRDDIAINKELAVALTNSLSQNRQLEDKLIKAQAQLDLLKELVSGSFVLNN